MAYNPRQTAAQRQLATETTSALRPDSANAITDARASMSALLQRKAMIDASPMQAKAQQAQTLAAGSGTVQRRKLRESPPPAAVAYQLLRVGVGVGDNDASNIEERDYDDDEQVTLTGNQHDTGVLANGRKLKHYMVAKNGTTYMLPLRYLNDPGEDPAVDGQFLVNTGAPARRGQQPEAFGGNVDVDEGVTLTESLKDSRDATLRREFQEESGGQNLGPAGDLDIVRSTYFRHQPGRFEGTASLVNTTLGLASAALANPGSVERGQAEMMGTIAIDTSDIPDGDFDDVADAIIDKISQARDGLIGGAGRDIFDVQGSVLALIVELIAAEVMLDHDVYAIENAEQLREDDYDDFQDDQYDEDYDDIYDDGYNDYDDFSVVGKGKKVK